MKGLRHVSCFRQRRSCPSTLNLRTLERGARNCPYQMCRPPHIIIKSRAKLRSVRRTVSRRAAPAIGIVSPTDDAQFLKALSLYLSSDFAYYHQFLTSTELGVKRDARL